MAFRFAIIDDAGFIRELLKQIGLQAGGVFVGEAENGTTGIELIKKALPDVLFLDLVMPEKNGLEIIAMAREIWPDIKIIACSTLDQDPIITKAKLLGVSEYITKPFTKEQVLQSLKGVLNG